MKTAFWFIVIAAVIGAVAYFGYQYFNQPGQCIRNAAGQCTTGQFSP
jgi:hypothetical protein